METNCDKSELNTDDQEEVDARPHSSPDLSADARPSEVDAKPIIKPPGSRSTDPIAIPTDRDCSHYVLEAGVKKVIIFNHKKFNSRLQLGERRGTEVDVKSIQNTFKTLDWEIDLYNDLTVSQIRDVILKDLQLSDQTLSALAIFILSHGEDNGTVFASDYPFRVDHDILVQLAADKCPKLAGKPKLIFVQVMIIYINKARCPPFQSS